MQQAVHQAEHTQQGQAPATGQHQLNRTHVTASVCGVYGTRICSEREVQFETSCRNDCYEISELSVCLPHVCEPNNI
jgi:hypothetical protein